MKYLIFILIILSSYCYETPKGELKGKANLEESQQLNKLDTLIIEKKDVVIDSVLDKIYNLSKIQVLNKSHKVSILIEEPSTPDEYYNFKVGYNSPDRFVTHYIFSFKKSESIIYYYDVLNDRLINAKEWK